MVKKKRENKKIKEFHFKNLNFNKKIISVILIVLAIGVIGSVFPGEGMTGMQTKKTSSSAFGNSFESLTNVLTGVNGIITSFFGLFFKGEDIQITYFRFILFILILSIIYYIAKSILGSDNNFINFLIGTAVAYLSIFFIPIDIITTTGLLYSSTFMAIVLLIPILIIWIIYFKLHKTRLSYLLRVIFLLIQYYLLIAIGDALLGLGLPLFVDILKIVMVLIWIGIIYAIFKAITVKGGEEAESKAIDEGIPMLKGTVYDWLGKVAKKMGKERPN